MIRATVADQQEIAAFLARRAEYAMFPLSNLRHFGMTGGHPNATTFWLRREAGQITDALSQTDRGMVMPVLPSQDYSAAAQAIKAREVTGIAGPKTWVRGLQTAAGLTTAAASLDQDEPHFLLRLDELHIPNGLGEIRPLSEAPPDVIKQWMLDYQLTALNTPASEAAERVTNSYEHYISTNSHVVLMDGDTPLAMTGFNARLPDIVQIGGVYTPPTLRGKGHARRAVALHLHQAKQSGIHRATLFSASKAATAAYRAIGFRQIGEWALLLLSGKQVILA